jgi:hypothetical protein
MAKKEKPKEQKPVDTKTKSPKNQKEQSARFIETARALGVDESGELFERVAEKIIKKTTN